MPLWLIYHDPAVTFTTPDSKAALTADITKFYTSVVGLPAFYVVVHFVPVPSSSTFIGGVPLSSGEPGASPKPFVRVTVDHVARKNEKGDEAGYLRIVKNVDGVMKPHMRKHGYEYEVHIDETEINLWMVNGLVPPKQGSEGEKLWIRENRAVPFGGVEDGGK